MPQLTLLAMALATLMPLMLYLVQRRLGGRG
jgi:hypothetical protein